MPRKVTTDEPRKESLDKMRVEFWMRAWLAYCSRQTVDVTKAKVWANQALMDFDSVFRGIAPPETPAKPVTVDELMREVMPLKPSAVPKLTAAAPANPTLVNAAFPTSEEVVMEVANHR